MGTTAAQQIKAAILAWDFVMQAAPLVVVSPELLDRLKQEAEEEIFRYDEDEERYLIFDCFITTAQLPPTTNPFSYVLALEEPNFIK